MRNFVFLVIFYIISFISATHAQADAAGEARRHFDAGNAAYSLGEFVHAAEEYKAAFKEKQDPAFLYNIGQAYRLAGDAGNAIFFYRSYLRNLPAARNRREVEDRITKLEQQLASGAPTPVAQEPSAPPSGKRLGDRHQTPPIIAHVPGRELPPSELPEPPAAKSLPPAHDAPPTDNTPPAHEAAAPPSSVDLTPSTAAATVDLTATPAPRHTPVYKKWWLWTTVGVVVVGAAAGITAGILLSKSGAPGSHFGTVGVYQ